MIYPLVLVGIVAALVLLIALHPGISFSPLAFLVGLVATVLFTWR